ncbi:MAG: protein phosphatase 2C domain-containing protein [Pseudomonadota bacterium]
MTRLRFFGLSDRGHVRACNEDHWFASIEEAAVSQSGLFIVSDGMSARPAGTLASQLVVEVLPRLLKKRMRDIEPEQEAEIAKQTRKSLIDLSRHVHEKSSKHQDLTGMGATIVMVIIYEHRALIAHLGDSRLYLLREEQLHLLTHDHSMLQYLKDADELQTDELNQHPARHQITQYIGMPEEVIPELSWLNLQAGDRLLLCSDGLHQMIDDRQIQQDLQGSINSQLACENLVKAALDAGGKDNVTVVVAECD